MKEIVTKILDVIMFLVPFFGKRKRNRIVREVRFTALLPVSIATSRRRMWTLPIAFGAFRVGGIIITFASRDR